MNSHTPGPFKVNLNPNTKHPTCVGMVVNADNERVIGINAGRRVLKEEIVSNAKLFAAAPDLLTALQELLALVQGECPSILEGDHHFTMVMNAIGKATE